jgi:hypothetical protein
MNRIQPGTGSLAGSPALSTSISVTGWSRVPPAVGLTVIAMLYVYHWTQCPVNRQTS